MTLQKAGINLTLQGEAQYIAGLRNVNREMDLMATNTKLAVAQLGQGASPTQKFNTQMRNMSAEIQKASTQTMILRNRNKELPNEIFKTGKSLDGLKDDYEKQVKVLESYRQKRDEVYKNNTFYSEDATKAREAFNEQQASVKELESEIKKLEGSYNGMLDEYERMPNTMAEAQLATQQLLNEQAKLRDEYLKSGGVLTGFADKLQSGGETLQKYGRHVSDLGDAFMGVTVGILAGGGGALKAFMDWEAALRGAMKTNDEVFDSNGNLVYSYEDLEDGLRGLSKEIPVANTELAEFAEIAGRLQVPTDEVVEFTEVVAKLGETTNLSGEEAAEQLGKFINITGASTSSTLNLANALVELGNNTAASEQETLRMSTRWASTGNIIGMTDDQILALSASVISLGIRTEAGGSAVQRSFLKINDAVLEGGDTLASFAETAGMSSSEFKKAWQDDAAQALIPFLKGLNDTHEAGGNVNSILRDLGITSVNELNTLLVLAGGYDQLAGNLEMASAAYNETEESMMALNKEAELAYGTTLGKLRTAWNRLKDSLIDIGEPIADAVLDMVDAAEPLFKIVEDLATGFSNLDATAQRDLINTVAKIALIAPALKIAGGAMSTLGDIFIVSAGLTRKAGGTITKAMLDSSGEVLAFGGAAQTATGSKGVGGLIASLAGSAGLPWALGIAAAALGGWTLWKVWGEDAWNAAEQTRKWGTVVGEETNDVLTDVQGLGSQITGEFGLIAQGFDTDSSIIAGNFTEIGETIENSVIKRISALDSLIEGLPETVSRTLSEIHEQEKDQSEKSLETIEQNNEEIARIRQGAADNNRELSRIELERINQMSRESIEAYVAQLPIAKSEQKQILDAMNGDVENATYEQAKSWARSLGEQRQQLIKHNEDQKREYLSSLEELGYSDEYVAQAGKMWDDLTENTTLGLEQQLATIAEKYPQIAEEILFSNGQIISGNEIFVESAKKSNEELLENAQSLSYRMGVAASLAAKQLSWMGDETTKAGQRWNDLVFDEKTGEVKTNAREVVIEAAKEIDVWNGTIRPQLKNADLDSNAKLIIGEAAIQNGYWDGMAWEDKQAVLQDNFSETVYQAIVDEGLWDELNWEERIAILNNGFTDTVIQAMIDDGRWEKLPWEQKEAILKTNTPETLEQVLKDIGVWNTLPISVRNLIVNNNQVYTAVDNAQAKINSLRGKSVTLQTVHESIYTSINRAGNSASSQRAAQSGTHMTWARGTNYHPGGLAMVNDQSGASFRELVTLPDGSSFIPTGRDALLDLPKGSKVLRAALTKMKFPDIKQYQDGVGYSRQQTQQIMSSNNTDMSQTNGLLRTLINLVNSGQDISINLNGQQIARSTVNYVNNENDSKMNYSQRGLAVNEY